MSLFPKPLLERLRACRVVATCSVENPEHAVPLAQALVKGGITAVELTLRTPAAMEAIRRVCAEVPDMLVGVGTILTPDQILAVKAARVAFGVAPGMNPKVIQSAAAAGLPFAPGICTPSELEAAMEHGCRLVKFFPAEASGGLEFLKSMAAPYRHLGIQYFPLGGLTAGNMAAYLKEDNVPCIGGSWIVKKELVDKSDWAGIAASAAATMDQLRR